jgi:hypothetical protein
MNELDKTSPLEENVTPTASGQTAPDDAAVQEETVVIESETEEAASFCDDACAETESPAMSAAEAADAAQDAAQCGGLEVCAETGSPSTEMAEAADSRNGDFKPFHSMNREELVNALREILAVGRLDAYREVNGMRKAYSDLKEKDAERELSEFIEAGNNPEDFSSTPNEWDEEFSNLSKTFRERRSEYVAAEEARRLTNLENKRDIIKKIVDLTEDIDNINLRFPEFKQLQADFKAIKEIPQSEENEVWKNFQAAVEQFYDRLKMNKELRDLDFKKNLEQKRLLIEEVKNLAAEEDVVAALRKLQDFREQWREVGPVAKEIRDEIWKEFNEAATVVFRRHQDFFEARKASEQEAEAVKTKLCEEAEAIAARECTRNSEWEQAANEAKALQERWKEAGFASRKVNNTLFARFRAACDEIFSRRNEHYRSLRESYDQAVKCKEALIVKVEALADSEDTQKAISEVLKIQEEWKHAGVVPHKLKDALWKRFRAACDVIFDRRKKETSSQRQEQNANLAAKREVIAALKEIPSDLDRKEGVAKVRELQDKWNSIGFVPFKHKDAVYEEYRSVVDSLYDNFKMKENRARMKNFSSQIDAIGGDDGKLGRERERLLRDLDRKRQELKTYQNNLGFFNIKSSAGNTMLKEMERRTRQIEEEIEMLRKKIDMVDEKIN